MRKHVSAVFLAAGLVVAHAVPGGAIPPQPADPAPFSLSAAQSCEDFGIEVQATGKLGYKALPGDRAVLIAPGATLQITNAATGESVTVHASGTFHETYPSELVIQAKITGHNVLLGPDVDGEPGVVAFVGRFDVTMTLDPATGIYSFDDISGHGQTTDVCAQLR